MTQKRILVVDDDEGVRLLVRRRLEGRHFQVDEAGSGSDAIAMLRADRYHLVVLDLIMGHGSGPDVLAAIELLEQPPKCVIISALANLWASQVGSPPFPVLQKPFAPERLLLLVQDELGILEVG